MSLTFIDFFAGIGGGGAVLKWQDTNASDTVR